MKHYMKQECIPVGWVPAARRPYAGVCFPGGGVCLVRVEGGSASSWGGLPGPGVGWGVCLVWGGVCLVWGGVCLFGGFCLVQWGLPGRGVSAWSGGFCLVWGVLPGPWGVCLVRGVYLVRGGLPGPGGVVSQHALRQTLPVNRMNDRHL